MKISKKTLTAGIVTLSIALASAVVYANKNHEHKGHGHSDSASLIRNAALGIDQAMKIALAEMPGKVIEAEIEQDDGVIVWEIEVLNSQNQVYEFEIDANSGVIIESERDDD